MVLHFLGFEQGAHIFITLGPTNYATTPDFVGVVCVCVIESLEQLCKMGVVIPKLQRRKSGFCDQSQVM